MSELKSTPRPTTPPLQIKEALGAAIARIQELEREVDRGKKNPDKQIAVIAIGCRFPGGANTPDLFWEMLRTSADPVRPTPNRGEEPTTWYDPRPDTAGKSYAQHGTYLEDVDQFDPRFFGISPREAASLDPQQRLLLEVGWETFENAGLTREQLAGSLTGVFIGATAIEYAGLLLESGGLKAIDPYFITGNTLNTAAGRIAYTFDLHGPCLAVDTACSSSLSAIHLAAQSLRHRESDLALAGGVNLVLAKAATIALAQAHMLAPDGRCKTFSAHANGYGRGEGCGLVLLKRLADALADGDPILAVIRGSAINQNGTSSGLTVPSSQAQQTLIRTALEQAGVTPADIDYVETHGTGTALGDPIEVGALTQIFGTTPRHHPLLLGALKTNIGHLEAAAGIAGFIKTVLAIHHRFLPANLHGDPPNPHISWEETTLRPVKQSTPWPDLPIAKPPLAGVSSFGASGTNAHVILTAPPPRTDPPPTVGQTVHLLTLSAETEATLRELAGRYATLLATQPQISLSDLCHSANSGRTPLTHRLAAITTTPSQLQGQLAAFQTGQTVEGIFTGSSKNNRSQKIAFLFTGQGSQYPDMAKELYLNQPIFRRVVDRCAEIVSPLLPRPLLEVLFPQSAQDDLINKTLFAQPALFTIGYALCTLWRSWGVQPYAVMGHSVGEYIAACVAGVFSLEDGLWLIAQRAILMDSLPGHGTMAAVFAPADTVRPIIAPFAKETSIAAINGPHNTVISGSQENIQAICHLLQQHSIHNQPLTVSHPFHSPTMEPILEPFTKAAQTVITTTPNLPLISNLTGTFFGSQPPTPDYWAKHVREPVQFQSGIETLSAQGITTFLEIGPHPVLSTLGGECFPEGRFLPSLQRGKNPQATLLTTLGTFFVSGHSVNWKEVSGNSHADKIRLPNTPMQKQRYWVPDKIAEGQTATKTKSSNEPFADWLYQVKWHPCPLPEMLPIADVVQKIVQEPVVQNYRNKIPLLENLGVLLAANALMTLGWKHGKPETMEQLFQTFQILPNQQKQFARLLAILEEAGVARHNHRDQWELITDTPMEIPDDLVLNHPEVGIELGLMLRCGTHMAELLRGRCDPLPLLFPANGDLAVAALYQDSLPAVVMNGLVAHVFDQTVKTLPSPIHILEIGAGTGSLTTHLLPLVPKDGTTYLFSDVSPQFFESARQKFKAFKFVTYQKVDIERPPEEQGLTTGKFNLIIAANVLHATRDLGQALDHIWQLLAPGGQLFLLEGTERTRLLDLIFGITPGWWHFTDNHLRPDHPLLSVDQWCTLLPQRGFQVVQTLATPPEKGGILAKQAVLIAKRPETSHQAQTRRFLILEDNQGIAAQLATRFQARGDQVERIAPDCFSLVAPLLRKHPPTRIIDCRALDHHPETRPNLPLFYCAALLTLVQTMVAENNETTPLTILTQGAAPGTHMDSHENLWQSPLWGMGQVIGLEYPKMGPVLLDLDPSRSYTADSKEMDLLWRALNEPTREDRLALRGGKRLISRLVKLNPNQEITPLRINPMARYLITGGFGGLGLLCAKWLAEKGARHIVLIGRSPPGDDAVQLKGDQARRGVVITLIKSDITKESAISDIVSASSLPIRGILHLAGTLDDGILSQLTEERFASVLSPKVTGAIALLPAVREETLDFLVFFSSTTALFGTPGQANHAAANVFLDHLAHWYRQNGLPAISINWGPWSGVGTVANTLRNTANGEKQALAKGWHLCTPEQGLAILEKILTLADPPAQIAVAPIDWPRFLASRPQSPFLDHFATMATPAAPIEPPTAPTIKEKTVDIGERLANASPDQRPQILRRHIREQTAAILGLDPEEIDPNQGFFELGMDSLTAMELRTRLQTGLGLATLPPSVIFTYPTATALAAHLLSDAQHDRPKPIDGADNDLSDTTIDEELDQIERELAVFQNCDKPISLPKQRRPHPEIAGKGRTLGDLVTPIVDENDWDCLK